MVSFFKNNNLSFTLDDSFKRKANKQELVNKRLDQIFCKKKKINEVVNIKKVNLDEISTNILKESKLDNITNGILIINMKIKINNKSLSLVQKKVLKTKLI